VDGDKSSIMVMEPPSPQCVGREFVRQYYTLLNQAPLHLHRFYSHNSSFVHGGLDNTGKDAQDAEAAAVYGQQEIHQKIMQLNFRDCHAKIRQVDSHETLANGVVVQVSGELSNNGEPMRRFMQTFVLAPQSPKKYYVHNDIFRYQDEVFNEGEESVGTSSLPLDSAEIEPAQIKKAQLMAQQAEAAKPVAPEQKIPMEQAANQVGQHLNGSNNSAGFEGAVQQEIMEVEDTIGEWKADPEPVASFQQAPATNAPQEPVQVWKAPEQPEAEPASASEAEVEESSPPAPVSNEPRTWASMAKQGAGSGAAAKPPAAPGGGQPTARAGESKEGTPFSQGKPYRNQRAGSQGRPAPGAPAAPGGGGPPMARPERFSKEEEMGRNRIMSSSDSQQLFVGNLPHDCTEDHLTELFGKYGKVTDVRINQKQGRDNAVARGGKAPAFVPNFGFIVFESTDCVERALAAKPIMLYGNHRLNVEEKKMRAPRDGNTYQDRRQDDRGNRGSQDNLRGAGHPGGRGGGGDRGRGDRGGRGGGRGRGDWSGGPRGGGRGGPPGEVRGSYRGGGRGN